MDSTGRIAPLVGRVLIAVLFVMAGTGKISGFDGTVGYIATKGLPLPEAGAIAAIVVELLGGLLLIAGFQTRIAALALFLFSAAAAILFHDFWNAPEAEFRLQMTMFLKNLSIMGGLLYVASYGPGPISVDRK